MKKLAFAIVGIVALIAIAIVTMRPTWAVQLLALVNCSTTAACDGGNNSNSGPGVQGISALGTGVVGQTKFASTSSSNGKAGVLGQDLSTSGTSDMGLQGTSARGIGVRGKSTSLMGVFGTSASFNGVVGVLAGSSGISVTPGGGVWGDSFADNGVVGSSVNGNGVYGLAGNGVGVAAFSTYNYAVKATSTNEDGVHAQTSHNSSATGTGYSGVFGQDVSSDGGHLNVGVAGWSTNGVGVSALSSNWVGANVSGGQGNGSGGKDYPALSVVGNGSFDLIDACSQGTNPCNASSSGGFGPAVFELTYFGRINMAGSIFTGGSCASGCLPTPTTGEKRVRFYTAQESLPTVEDFGDAQLINGQAYVHIDPAFANTMDQRAHYMVFVTPEGDSRGLYVTQKTLTGFAVHENQGGRSTLAFSYRIIAKPYGDQSMRLQMFTMAKPRANRARSL